MDEKEHDELSLEEKLKALERDTNGRMVIFLNEEETESLRRMIQRERAWDALGKLGGSIKTVFLWIGIVMATWAAIKVGFLEWLNINMQK